MRIIDCKYCFFKGDKMRLGLGLYNHQLNDDYYSFAEQTGCTDLIIHLVTYYNNEIVSASSNSENYRNVEKDEK